MRPELARMHRIECALLGRPQPAEAPDWQVQLLLDPELAADAAAQQQLYQGLRRAGQHQLRRELAVIHQRLYPRASGTWWRQLLQRLHPSRGPFL